MIVLPKVCLTQMIINQLGNTILIVLPKVLPSLLIVLLVHFDCISHFQQYQPLYQQFKSTQIVLLVHNGQELFNEERRQKTNHLLHTLNNSKSLENRASHSKQTKEENQKEDHLWNAILICFVKSQVLIFVFLLFCNHLADQKYPQLIPLSAFRIISFYKLIEKSSCRIF